MKTKFDYLFNYWYMCIFWFIWWPFLYLLSLHWEERVTFKIYFNSLKEIFIDEMRALKE